MVKLTQFKAEVTSKKLEGYILTKQEILERLRTKRPLVSGYVDLQKQLQPAGFELTVGEMGFFRSSGVIDFSDAKRKIPDVQTVDLSGRKSKRIPAGAYVIRFNEKVCLPKDILSLIFPRSSLMRSGAILYTAVWDPGYEGRGQGLLCVFNKHGLTLYKNARAGQMIFIKLKKHVKEGYEGIYQREGLPKSS